MVAIYFISIATTQARQICILLMGEMIHHLETFSRCDPEDMQRKHFRTAITPLPVLHVRASASGRVLSLAHNPVVRHLRNSGDPQRSTSNATRKSSGVEFALLLSVRCQGQAMGCVGPGLGSALYMILQLFCKCSCGSFEGS